MTRAVRSWRRFAPPPSGARRPTPCATTTPKPPALSWVIVEGDITSKLDGSYRFDPVDGGTLVTYQLEVELRVPIPGFVKHRAAQRIQTTALRELKARAESLA